MHDAAMGLMPDRAGMDAPDAVLPDPFNDAGTDTIQVAQAARPGDTAHASIRVFPEGGNLVNSLPSMIAVEAIDRSGQGVRCSGAVVDQDRDTVVQFHESWRIAAHDKALHGRFSHSFAGQTFLIVRASWPSPFVGRSPSRGFSAIP